MPRLYRVAGTTANTRLLSTALAPETPPDLSAGLEQAREAAHTVYVRQGVVVTVAERYLDGLNPLFSDVAADVGEQVAETERVIGVCNQVLVALAPPRGRSRRDHLKAHQPQVRSRLLHPCPVHHLQPGIHLLFGAHASGTGHARARLVARAIEARRVKQPSIPGLVAGPQWRGGSGRARRCGRRRR